ncbi:MAG: deoxyribodipyrimidine photo-lyase [Cyanobacteria bacterium J06581_3]
MLFEQTIGDLPDRVTVGNQKPVASGGQYVLVVLNRALRGQDNAVIDGAIAHANHLSLSIVVYSELDEGVDWASDRLFYFALGAFKELAVSLRNRNIFCIQHIKSADDQQLTNLAINAAAIYTDEDYTHWDRAKLQSLLEAARQTVFLVDASRLVPTRKLPEKLRTTSAFRKASGELREKYAALRQQCLESEQINGPAYQNSNEVLEQLAEKYSNFADYNDADIAKLVDKLNINHDIPVSIEHPPTRAVIEQRIETLKTEILARYKWIRNNPALEHSTSELSPYLHFGMVSPHQVLSAVENSDVQKTYTWKFRDEFLTWREWSHYQAFYSPNIHEFDGLSNSAKKTLLAHADDKRPELMSNEDIIEGNTPDATWNAAQREWLSTGWLHNNLRMYWAKQILRFTESPQAAWEMACYINDYISLDGRDPATYASMQWAFGNAKPGYSEKEIYGWVAPKSDRAILKRKGMKEWIAVRQPT